MKFKSIAAAFFAAAIVVASLPSAYAQSGDKLKEITELSLSTKSYFAVDFEGDKMLAVAFDTSKSEKNYELYVVDATTAEINKKASFKSADFHLNEVSDCKINSDGSYTVFDYVNGKTSVFTDSLTYKASGTCKKVSSDYSSLGKDNKLISNKFIKYKDCARCSYTNDFASSTYAMAFYNDNSGVYLTDDKDIETVFSSSGKKCLASQFSNDKHIVNLAVYDYENKYYVSASTRSFKGYNLSEAIYGKIDGDYAFAVVESDKKGSGFYTPLIWNYSDETSKHTFSSTKVNEKDIKQYNSDYIVQLKNKYGISVYIDIIPKTYPTYRDNQTGKEYGGVVKGANTFDTYILLKDLTGYLTYFPKKFIGEIANYGGRKRDFSIYIDKEVIGDSAAFANRIDGFFICFATDEYDHYYIPHEFFHLIEGRVEHYYTGLGKNYEKEWNKLNPSGFMYYSGQEFNSSYFASEYAMTDSKEDRADTFEYLFEAYKAGSHPYAQNGVRKKAIFITESIRAAFPSVQKVELASWERWIVPYPVKAKFKSTDNYIKLYWSNCRTADKYEVQQKSKGVWKTVYSGVKKKHVIKNLKNGTALSFRVRACRTDNGKKICSSWQIIHAATKPVTPKAFKITTNVKHKIGAKWKKVKRCDGYEVQFSRNKTFKNPIATRSVKNSSKKYIGKGFTKGKTYYVRIRSYVLAGNKRVYSEWTKTKKIKSK